jgi:hypothetical protein
MLPSNPGWLGTMEARKVDMGQPPEAQESQFVGDFSGIIVIPPADPAPQPFSDRWPPDDPAIAEAIHDVLLPHVSKAKDDAA